MTEQVYTAIVSETFGRTVFVKASSRSEAQRLAKDPGNWFDARSDQTFLRATVLRVFLEEPPT